MSRSVKGPPINLLPLANANTVNSLDSTIKLQVTQA